MLETLKASGDALKQIGATGQGLRAVEDIVSEVESNLQHAADITSVLSAGSVTGMVNSMCAHGVVIDEEELIRELAETYTIVIVTHNMQQAQRVARHSGFMWLGELLEFGDTASLFTAPREIRTADYVGGRYG